MIAPGGFTRMRQQCGVLCYGETRSQLTIQVERGLVRSQLSFPRRTTADNFSRILFFEKTRFSISLLSLYLYLILLSLSPHMLAPESSKRSSIASGSAQWFDERGQYSESLPNRPDARRNTVQCSRCRPQRSIFRLFEAAG